jgi:hypothetical protein
MVERVQMGSREKLPLDEFSGNNSVALHSLTVLMNDYLSPSRRITLVPYIVRLKRTKYKTAIDRELYVMMVQFLVQTAIPLVLEASISPKKAEYYRKLNKDKVFSTELADEILDFVSMLEDYLALYRIQLNGLQVFPCISLIRPYCRSIYIASTTIYGSNEELLDACVQCMYVTFRIIMLNRLNDYKYEIRTGIVQNLILPYEKTSIEEAPKPGIIARNLHSEFFSLYDNMLKRYGV